MGDRTCSRPLLNALRRSLVSPSALPPVLKKPRLQLLMNKHMDPVFKGTPKNLSVPESFKKVALKGLLICNVHKKKQVETGRIN